jgi:hypothetical protein
LPDTAATRADDPVELVIDASKTAGEVRPLHGVNGEPLGRHS